jgi:hypothetical protein
MRSVAGVALIYLLAVLLVSTSPMGAGQGVHRDQLVDLLVPHTHYVTSATDVHRGQRQVASEPSSTPSVGAGAGASASSIGAVLTPPVPDWASVALGAHSSRLGLVSRVRAPVGWRDPPPDPPPTSVS